MPHPIGLFTRPAAASGGGAWTPASLSGLVAWWDFSDTATITQSGGLISQINDKSGNGNHLTQSTGSLQPSTGTRTINSLNVGDFVNDYLTASITQSAPLYIAFVGLGDSASTQPFFSNGTGGACCGPCWNGDNKPWLSTGIALGAVPYLSTASFLEVQFTVSDSTMWQNGASRITGGSTGSLGGTFDLGHATVGGDNTLDGAFGEVWIASGTVNAESNGLAYSQSKWGTP